MYRVVFVYSIYTYQKRFKPSKSALNPKNIKIQPPKISAPFSNLHPSLHPSLTPTALNMNVVIPIIKIAGKIDVSVIARLRPAKNASMLVASPNSNIFAGLKKNRSDSQPFFLIPSYIAVAISCAGSSVALLSAVSADPVGDFVLTGGEIASMIVVDSVVRLIPGVLGDDESVSDESHKEDGYIEYPQYTRPEEFKGVKVPKILLPALMMLPLRFV